MRQHCVISEGAISDGATAHPKNVFLLFAYIRVFLNLHANIRECTTYIFSIVWSLRRLSLLR